MVYGVGRDKREGRFDVAKEPLTQEDIDNMKIEAFRKYCEDTTLIFDEYS